MFKHMDLQLFASNLGVFPVFDLEFKIGINGRESAAEDMVVIKEMETFSPSIDGNVEEWTPMDTKGWVRRLMTGKGFTITLNGKRHVGDPGNDYVAGLAWKTGRDCCSTAEIVFPDGDKLTFDCIINVPTPFGGDSTNVSTLEIELQSDGKPTYVPTTGVLTALDFVCVAGSVEGTTKITSVDPVKTGDNSYVYKINGVLPVLGEDVQNKGWAPYTLDDDIVVNDGNMIALVEVDASIQAQGGGRALAVVNPGE